MVNWKTHRREPWDLSLNDAMSRTSDRNFDYKARGKTSKHATEELQIVLFKEFGRNHLIEEKSGEQLYNYKYKRTSGNKSPVLHRIIPSIFKSEHIRSIIQTFVEDRNSSTMKTLSSWDLLQHLVINLWSVL